MEYLKEQVPVKIAVTIKEKIDSVTALKVSLTSKDTIKKVRRLSQNLGKGSFSTYG